ncbi:MAG: site-specific DNA-methyltransferase [Cytophagales bacterium]|nr:site-specific DNA-methyltransferase [Cytophagales bacterium]
MIAKGINLDTFVKAVNDRSTVSGYTHDFYNYPARFSPLFAREAIESFTEPGDFILDPFMGGGTTLVEAQILNRPAIGFDISSLAYFIASVKTSPLTEKETEFVKKWTALTIKKMNCKSHSERPEQWIEAGYQRNLSNKTTWPIRKLSEQFINDLEKVRTTVKVKNFLRCVLLKTGQWALDSKKEIPSAKRFRAKLWTTIEQMLVGSTQLKFALAEHKNDVMSLQINKPAIEIKRSRTLKKSNSPKLVLTSPPYPGIHVVYHRWQIHGSKETPAPFWIANSLDGHGLTHYTMGNRQQEGLINYFQNIKDTFSSVAKVCDNETLIVQVLAFSKPEWQLPKYLEVMKLAGFYEIKPFKSRIWREVPNRKWYTQNKGKTPSSNEVVLFHRLIS